MAEKRMYSKKVTNSDEFISLSSSAQALYFHLNQEADDDGFNNQIQTAMYKSHASEDDLKILIAKRFVIRFESGVIVIKHWRMHNTLRKDRYTETDYKEEFESLNLTSKGEYTLDMVANWLPDGYHSNNTNTESLSKEKDIRGMGEEGKTKKFQKPTVEEIQMYITEKGYMVNAEKFFNYYESNGWKVGKNAMKDWKACIRTWNASAKEKVETSKPKESRFSKEIM